MSPLLCARRVALVAVLATTALAPAAASATDPSPAEQATAVIEHAYPSALRDSAGADLGRLDGQLQSVNSDAHVELPREAAGPLVLNTISGDLRLSQLDVATRSGDAQRVSSDAAVWTGVGSSTDQLVKVLSNGFESFTAIYDQRASEALRWRIQLTPSQHLTMAPDGGVMVLDSDAPVPTSPTQAPRPDRLAPPPSEVAQDEAQHAATYGPDQAAINRAIDQEPAPAPFHPPAGPGDPADAAKAAEGLQQLSAEDQQIQRDNADNFEQTARESHQNDVQIDAVNERNHEQNDALIAVISAPEAKDAHGAAVKAEYSIDGDVITMHVDHREQSVAYPVVADPWVSVTYPDEKTGQRPVMGTETYVSGVQFVQIPNGNWNFLWCTGTVVCNNHGNGWYDVHYKDSAGQHDYAVFQDDGWWSHQVYVGQAVYSTRTVQVGWETYTYTENVTENVWVPDDWNQLTFDQEALTLDAPYADTTPDNAFLIGDSLGKGDDATSFVNAGRRYARKDCRYAHDVTNVNGPVPTGGKTRLVTSTMDTNFCWNQTKKRAAFNNGIGSTGVMEVNLVRAKKWATLGLKATVLPTPRIASPEAWNGGSQGAIRMERWFALEGCTPILKISCSDPRNYRHTTWGYWDGHAYAEIRGR